MNCHQVRKVFSLYYDSEGDAGLQLAIGDHLATCPDCKQWFQQQSRREDALVKMLSEGTLTSPVWARVEKQVQRSVHPPSRRADWSWRKGGLLALACGLLLIVLFGLRTGGDDSEKHLSALAAVAHQRYVNGGWRPDVRSESVEEVERALRVRAGFAVRCPPQGQAGFRLKGGGVCTFHSETGVHIVGEVHRRPVSVIILPAEALASFPQLRHHLEAEGQTHRCQEGPYRMVASRLHGHLVVVMGQLEYQVLSEILSGYGSHQARVSGKGGQAPFASSVGSSACLSFRRPVGPAVPAIASHVGWVLDPPFPTDQKERCVFRTKERGVNGKGREFG